MRGVGTSIVIKPPVCMSVCLLVYLFVSLCQFVCSSSLSNIPGTICYLLTWHVLGSLGKIFSQRLDNQNEIFLHIEIFKILHLLSKCNMFKQLQIECFAHFEHPIALPNTSLCSLIYFRDHLISTWTKFYPLLTIYPLE